MNNNTALENESDGFPGMENDSTKDFISAELIADNKILALPYLQSQPDSEDRLECAIYHKHQVQVLLLLFDRHVLADCNGKEDAFSNTNGLIKGYYPTLQPLEEGFQHFDVKDRQPVISQGIKKDFKLFRKGIEKDKAKMLSKGVDPLNSPGNALSRQWWAKLRRSMEQSLSSLNGSINFYYCWQTMASPFWKKFFDSLSGNKVPDTEIAMQRLEQARLISRGLYAEMLYPLIPKLNKLGHLDSSLALKCTHTYDANYYETYVTGLRVFCEQCGWGKNTIIDAKSLEQDDVGLPLHCPDCKKY